MEDQEGLKIENLSLRTSLVRLVIEHFVYAKQFEMLDVDVLSKELTHILKTSLNFETRLELDNNPDLIAKGVLSGKIMFLDVPVDDQKLEGFKVVDFTVMPSAMTFN